MTHLIYPENGEEFGLQDNSVALEDLASHQSPLVINEDKNERGRVISRKGHEKFGIPDPQTEGKGVGSEILCMANMQTGRRNSHLLCLTRGGNLLWKPIIMMPHWTLSQEYAHLVFQPNTIKKLTMETDNFGVYAGDADPEYVANYQYCCVIDICGINELSIDDELQLTWQISEIDSDQTGGFPDNAFFAIGFIEDEFKFIKDGNNATKDGLYVYGTMNATANDKIEYKTKVQITGEANDSSAGMTVEGAHEAKMRWYLTGGTTWRLEVEVDGNEVHKDIDISTKSLDTTRLAIFMRHFAGASTGKIVITGLQTKKPSDSDGFYDIALGG